MKSRRFSPLLSLLLVAAAQAQNMPVTTARITTSFDADWRFLKEWDPENAQQPSLDDSSWRKLDVPHDWAIEGPFLQNAPTRGGGGYAPSGIGWYRKTFTLPADYQGRKIFIEFDGVMANSDVYINGTNLGHRPYGYSSFRYEMTDKLNYGPGKTNVLAVRTDTSQQPASRFYAGAGIYRHVRLVVADPVHIDQWGTFITTPQVSADSATVRIQTTVINQSTQPRQVSLRARLIAPDGSTAASSDASAQMLNPGGNFEFDQSIKVNAPKIWDLDMPNMYRAVVAVNDGGKTIDDDSVNFGIRSFDFKTESGFWLNGRNFKLLGVCLHSDGGAFGMAVPNGVWEHRFKALKELGVNAIRCAHNPPSPDFLEVCDRMGMLVMDEDFDAWTVSKVPNGYDYHLYFRDWWQQDLSALVRRDRNHPSIILYSAGNEIHDTPNEQLALSLLRPMVDEFHKWDPTRPVTQALFRPNVSHDYTNGLADMLDVIGTNYRDVELIQAWKDKPGRKIIGTEQQHGLDTWLNLRDNPQHSGQFLWSGIDYLGESGWPSISAGSGLLDRTGAIKPIGYQRQSWWSKTPMVRIVRSETGGGGRGGRGGGTAHNWTPREAESGGQANLQVYSNCEEVELILNDKSQGVKTKPADDSPRTWQVPFEAGVIEAVAKNGGKVVASDVLRTAGAPAKIILSAEKEQLAPTWDDVSFIKATIVDEKGIQCPYADHLVSFKVTGPGVVAATDNGLGSSSESFTAPQRNAYQGRLFAIIKANATSGQITVSASAEGLAGGTVSIQAAK